MMKNLILISTLLALLTTLSACDRTPPPVEGPDGAAAHWISSDKLIWNPDVTADSYAIIFAPEADLQFEDGTISGGSRIVLGEGSSLTESQQDTYRHISHKPVFTVNTGDIDIHEAIRGQVIAVAMNGDRLVKATHVQFPGLIDELFAYDGTLGPYYGRNSVGTYLWAPTAHSVVMNLYDQDKNLLETVSAVDDSPENGVYQFQGSRDWDRKFYAFEVTVYHRELDRIETFLVTDPYSVSLATDSEYSQFVDLANDSSLKPRGWDRLVKTQPRPVDISLYEAHVRDFSIVDRSIPEEHRGTYLAFTYNGQAGRPLSDGMAHLQRLSDAGMTHLHLLPVNDIATVIEDTDRRVDLWDPYERICELVDHDELIEHCEKHGDTPIVEVFEQLAAENPVTKEIQKPYYAPGRYNGMAAKDGFNWGYDPFHFNAPEGSYATDPDGPARILELRQMVQALHQIGLHVVVDVVYNHTFASVDHRASVLDKVVPGYYHRYDAITGAMETSTCCDNTAAEHYMMERLIIDSILLWAEHYKIDSFRFDLMGHHPLYVMERLMDALAELTPEEHGVDGPGIYVYGEGWNFGEVADNRMFDQATQFNMYGTGIGTFNDRMRDGIRSGNFSSNGRLQGFTSGLYLFPNEDETRSREDQLSELLGFADRIRVGMTGNLSDYKYENRYGEIVTGRNEYIGYAQSPQEAVNYIDKHDNETYWDNTQPKLPRDMSMEDRIRVHTISNALINYGQGIPFFQMGSDILRSKSLDRNSFDSGDWFNRVDFTLETHNWGIGLPPGWDNRNRWEAMEPFLTQEGLDVTKDHMLLAHELFMEQLKVRYSSPLFRLATQEEVSKRLIFHNTGPDQVPGLIVMSVSDGRCAGEVLDPNHDGILVVVNSHIEARNFDTGLEGLELHQMLRNSTDQTVRNSAISSDGMVTIPPLTAAVFVKKQGSSQGDFICNE